MGGRQSGRPLAATNVQTAGSVCKRDDAVRLVRKEGLQPRASERPAVACSAELGGSCAFSASLRSLEREQKHSRAFVRPLEGHITEFQIVAGRERAGAASAAG